MSIMMSKSIQEETAGQEFLRMVKESCVHMELCNDKYIYIAAFGKEQVVFIFSFGTNRIIYSSDRGLWMNGKVIKNDHLKLSIFRLIQRTYSNPEETITVGNVEAKKVLVGLPLIPGNDVTICKVK